MTKLLVNEIFGPTVQGEGVSTGRHCMFVRLYRCNQTCTWCDSPQTWVATEALAKKHIDGKVYRPIDESHQMTIEDVIYELSRLYPLDNSPTIVISGGEPLMQQEMLAGLLQALDMYDCPIQIETAGTITPTPDVDRYVSLYNVSPKLQNSGNPLGKRRKSAPLNFFAGCDRANFKFVCSSVDDLTEVTEIVNEFGIPRSRVMVMPEGIDVETIRETAYALSEKVLHLGYGMSLRNHIWIWGNRRGV